MNSTPLTISDFEGTYRLSEEIYEIVCEDSNHGVIPNYRKGDRVRLISGVNENPKPGYHPARGWRTVCSVNATVAWHIGFPRGALKRISNP